MATGDHDLHIHVFDESIAVPDRVRPPLRLVDFGGALPQIGDLIALPVSEEVDRGSQRMRAVVERHFWPSIDPRVPARISLLVRERRGRKISAEGAAVPAARARRARRGSQASDIPFIIQQIYTCLNAAKESADREVAAALHRVAEAFADRAIALGADPATIPRATLQSSS
jgi:hypothetical protein